MKFSINTTNICVILFVGLLLFAIFLSPYKETLVCEGNECIVNRSYIIPTDDSSISYSFKRNDYIEIKYHRGARYGGSNYLYNNKYRIFENGFDAFSSGPYKIFDLIRSDKPNIKATKYMFGYKIEKS